jgi:RHH-type rel operon transcriptional repressor/antitoxin RelB
MLAVRLPETLDDRLTELSEQTHRSKSFYVKQAIQDYLDEHEDHLLALARLEKKNPRIDLEEMERRLDLED